LKVCFKSLQRRQRRDTCHSVDDKESSRRLPPFSQLPLHFAMLPRSAGRSAFQETLAACTRPLQQAGSMPLGRSYLRKAGSRAMRAHDDVGANEHDEAIAMLPRSAGRSAFQETLAACTRPLQQPCARPLSLKGREAILSSLHSLRVTRGRLKVCFKSLQRRQRRDTCHFHSYPYTSLCSHDRQGGQPFRRLLQPVRGPYSSHY
jgi:hypothetical protein